MSEFLQSCVSLEEARSAIAHLLEPLFELSTEQNNNLTTAKRQLARNVAEQISLAFSNLRLQEELQHQSIRDDLTGLYNRRYLEEALEREMERAQRTQKSLGLIMLDVDHFKQFNDTWGHAAGDEVLQAVGQFLIQGVIS
ncbi:diguanylate cyclase [Halothece sp. PCC 7418]|uniref:GGDEF domain-containing protein n=1 Tax=Halothece sp. (strain PCC 7418) TaxID=65093 RepID=UPI0002A0764A|nr:GGDEF domain-containing protein [Halothece sp. PCC 7418]AFZ45377.1 diguanylate cyclase [Halothece sp. PCC 7418]